MKNKIAILLGLMFCAASAPAEVVESVSFNPSRLGQFERLKISDQLSAPGGVQSSRVTVRSGGRVTAQNAGNYQLDYALSGGQVAMPATLFETTNLKARGGEGEFAREGNGYTSSISTLQGDQVRLKANVLKVNTINVLGSPAQSYDENSIQGLVLGLNDIPNPAATGNCSLQWVERKADDGTKYQVLANSCTSTTTCSRVCLSGFTLNKTSCTCECQKTSCASGYKLNKTTCQCEQEGQWCLGATYSRTAAAGAFDGNLPMSCYTGERSVFTNAYYSSIFPTSSNWLWAAMKYCLGIENYWDVYSDGSYLGCTPGTACAACSQTANQSKRWVFNFKSADNSIRTGSDNYKVILYAWDEAICQYSSEDCSKLLSGSSSSSGITTSTDRITAVDKQLILSD